MDTFLDLFFQFDLYAGRLISEYIRYRLSFCLLAFLIDRKVAFKVLVKFIQFIYKYRQLESRIKLDQWIMVKEIKKWIQRSSFLNLLFRISTFEYGLELFPQKPYKSKRQKNCRHAYPKLPPFAKKICKSSSNSLPFVKSASCCS